MKSRESKSDLSGLLQVCSLWSHHFMAKSWGKSGNSSRFHFWGFKIAADGDYSHKIIRHLLLGRKAISILKLDSILKTGITLLTKAHLIKSVVFPVVTYGRELDRKGKALKNWCFRTVVLGKTPESPLDRKEIKPVNCKGNQLRIFIGRIDAEAAYFGHLMQRTDPGKDPDAGKDWGQHKKATTEDELAGWHHQLDGHEFEQTPGDSQGQARLLCCSPRGRKELDMTQQVNNNKCSHFFHECSALWLHLILITLKGSTSLDHHIGE